MVGKDLRGLLRPGEPSEANAWKIIYLAMINLVISILTELVVVLLIIRIGNLFKRHQPNAREKLEAISIEDLRRATCR